MPDWRDIFAALREDGIAIADKAKTRAVGGGDISATWRIEGAERPLFVKTGSRDSLDMFEAEAEGLRELAAAEAVRVPGVLACGYVPDSAYLVTEWIDFERPTERAEQLFGRQLAAMHRCRKERFGWHRDNTIGLTPQYNRWSEDWVEFFGERRLGFQLRLAREKGFGGELETAGARLMQDFAVLFNDYRPESSLLHGDLWGGNWAAANGQPVIFDPAVHYGDRECDLAMTRLFGGFGSGFYAAYQESWPLAAGWEDRLKLYQLYHVLNHLNLFGRSYLGRALTLIRNLNSAIPSGW